MLSPRLIPCLLVDEGRLVKTVNFSSPTYVGDPLNAVRIFNEKKVDELILLDISATRNKRSPDFDLVERLAQECRMPLCYGGGVRTPQQVEKIISVGVEKVAIGSALKLGSQLLRNSSERVGRQSIVAVVNVRGDGDAATLSEPHRQESFAPSSVIEYCQHCAQSGAGELLIHSTDRDGSMRGYDLALARRVREGTEVPITILGGAGKLDDVQELFKTGVTVGAAAGSLFVFKGSRRAVLINYPTPSMRSRLNPRTSQTEA